jgi:hypothetical protein
MVYYLKVLLLASLIMVAVLGFVSYIAYQVEHSTKCTCEMVKNHECP